MKRFFTYILAVGLYKNTLASECEKAIMDIKLFNMANIGKIFISLCYEEDYLSNEMSIRTKNLEMTCEQSIKIPEGYITEKKCNSNEKASKSQEHYDHLIVSVAIRKMQLLSMPIDELKIINGQEEIAFYDCSTSEKESGTISCKNRYEKNNSFSATFIRNQMIPYTIQTAGTGVTLTKYIP